MTPLAVLPGASDPHAGVRTFESYRGPIRERCQVVVVGSGPGGAVVAKELAEAGKDVILVEEGPPFAAKDFRPEAGASLRRTFREGGMRVARGDAFIPTMQAIGLGGGSLVNSAISARAPGWALDKWAADHGTRGIFAGVLDDDYAAVEEFLGIAPTADDVLGERNLLFKRGCDALGWSSAPTPRNVRECKGSAECFTGCRNGAKQSTDITYVPAAIRAGARVLTGVRIDQVIGDGDRVTGVRGRTVEAFTGKEGDVVEILADQVVLAAGCMATPCILSKSGIGTASGHVGKHLHGHPGLAVCGVFDHAVDPWTGATQGYHSLEFLKEGMKLEVLWAPPAIISVRFPGFGKELKEHLMHFDRMAPFDVFVNAGHSDGSVRAPSFGKQPDIRFQLDQRDVDLLKRGVLLLADICWAAGATAVLPGVHGVPDVLRSKADQKLLADHPMRATDATIGMNHVFGTTRMGDDPKDSVVDGFGRVHGVANLWIADTGVFAGSPAVNPMLTCMALARRTARAMVLARKKGQYPRMADCRRCGAPLPSAHRETVVCQFCNTSNDPPPNEVIVPVPVQIVHNVVHVVQQAGSRAPVELRCGSCRKRLVGVRVADVELSGCAGCGGIWVDNASASALVAAPQRVFIELATNAGKNARNRRPPGTSMSCPVCTAILDRVRSHGIELDVCSEHGTWFDAYELRELTEKLLVVDAPKVPRITGDVSCVRCKEKLPAERANIGEAGPTCDACWRIRQGELASERPSIAHAASEMLEASGDFAKTAGVGTVFLAAIVGGLGAGVAGLGGSTHS